MSVNIEEALGRELREVAAGVRVPARPPLPQEPPRPRPHWQPLLVAAAVILIVAGAVTVALSRDGGGVQEPVKDPTPSPTSGVLTAAAPTVPYVIGERLYVSGKRVAGKWWTVKQAGGAWVAERERGTWWWGTDTEPVAFTGKVILTPHLSPDGSLLAVATDTNGGEALLIDTRSGESLGTLSLDAYDQVGVRAVTDDGKVFLEGDTDRLMWLAPDGETVDLDTTAPGQSVYAATSAGVHALVENGNGGDDAFVLNDVNDAGEFTRLRTLTSDSDMVNPSGTWLAYGGSWGGESKTIPYVTTVAIEGSDQVRLNPPDSRALLAVTFEDEDLLLAELHRDGDPTGLARCSIRQAKCLVVATG